MAVSYTHLDVYKRQGLQVGRLNLRRSKEVKYVGFLYSYQRSVLWHNDRRHIYAAGPYLHSSGLAAMHEKNCRSFSTGREIHIIGPGDLTHFP